MIKLLRKTHYNIGYSAPVSYCIVCASVREDYPRVLKVFSTNVVDPNQAAHRSSLIWVHNVSFYS